LCSGPQRINNIPWSEIKFLNSHFEHIIFQAFHHNDRSNKNAIFGHFHREIDEEFNFLFLRNIKKSRLINVKKIVKSSLFYETIFFILIGRIL
jgi:hypothetical protein